MTKHTEHNDDLNIPEPGCDENPLEHEPTYNPLQYCYLVPATIDTENYELAVKFQLQTHNQITPIDFIDPKTNKPHSTPFYPQPPENSLEPDNTGPDPETTKGYQAGETTYHLVPTLHRCKHTETGELLTREAAQYFITPEVLQQALLDYLQQIEQDPNAPTILHELLTMWDPNHWDNTATTDWEDENNTEDNWQ